MKISSIRDTVSCGEEVWPIKRLQADDLRSTRMDEPDAIWCVEGCGAMLSGCLIDKPANFVERVGEDPGGSS